MNSTNSRLTIASAAAMLALSSVSLAPAAFAADSGTVHCFGVNSCKGTSDCKSYNHDCKGLNSCKGQGFKELSAKECKAEHGSTTQPAVK